MSFRRRRTRRPWLESCSVWQLRLAKGSCSATLLSYSRRRGQTKAQQGYDQWSISKSATASRRSIVSPRSQGIDGLGRDFVIVVATILFISMAVAGGDTEPARDVDHRYDDLLPVRRPRIARSSRRRKSIRSASPQFTPDRERRRLRVTFGGSGDVPLSYPSWGPHEAGRHQEARPR
jgi:hypothetical protein